MDLHYRISWLVVFCLHGLPSPCSAQLRVWPCLLCFSLFPCCSEYAKELFKGAGFGFVCCVFFFFLFYLQLNIPAFVLCQSCQHASTHITLDMSVAAADSCPVLLVVIRCWVPSANVVKGISHSLSLPALLQQWPRGEETVCFQNGLLAGPWLVCARDRESLREGLREAEPFLGLNSVGIRSSWWQVAAHETIHVRIHVHFCPHYGPKADFSGSHILISDCGVGHCTALRLLSAAGIQVYTWSQTFLLRSYLKLTDSLLTKNSLKFKELSEIRNQKYFQQ